VTEEERTNLLADEWLIVRDSGEIPEITFHSSVYYLTEDGDGPGLILAEDELVGLKDAAVLRYHEIILRDISLENFHKTIYRGVRRSLYNWHRCKAFIERQSVPSDDFYKTAALALLFFLEQGVAAAGKDLPVNFIKCSFLELIELAGEFGITLDQLPFDVAQFCL
jgi:hypothetical protein